MKRGEALKKIWERTKKDPETECWHYPKTNDKGYPYCYYDGKWQGAHRVVFQLTGNTLMPGEPVHHKCGTHDCVNPAHLQKATAFENTLESMSRNAMERRIDELEEALRLTIASAQRVLDGIR